MMWYSVTMYLPDGLSDCLWMVFDRMKIKAKVAGGDMEWEKWMEGEKLIERKSG